MMYVYLPGHPRTKNCVSYSEASNDNTVICDYNQKRELIGIEFIGEYLIKVAPNAINRGHRKTKKR